MAKKPFGGNYLKVEFRVSYDKKTDSINLTSKDKDLQGEKGFRLTLNRGRDAEHELRKLLEREGLIPKGKPKEIPDRVLFGNSQSHGTWNKFPLGEFANSKEVIWDPTKSPNILLSGSAGSGKSVIQRNIIFHCIQHPKEWSFLGVDLKQVELTPYLKYTDSVLGVATNVESALEAILFTHEEMLSRYQTMEESGANNFRDLDTPPKALMLMVDEAFMLFAQSGRKDPEALKEDSLKAEALKKIFDIANLGRPTGIHLVLATQRVDGSIFSGELRQHLSTRIATGRMDYQGSYMTLNNDQATKLNGSIKCRGYFQEFGEGAEFQAYFAPQDWIDNNLN